VCKVFSAIRELVDIVKKTLEFGARGSGVGQGRCPCSRTTINLLSRGSIFPSLIYFLTYIIIAISYLFIVVYIVQDLRSYIIESKF
jgi:hypothetical protein